MSFWKLRFEQLTLWEKKNRFLIDNTLIGELKIGKLISILKNFNFLINRGYQKYNFINVSVNANDGKNQGGHSSNKLKYVFLGIKSRKVPSLEYKNTKIKLRLQFTFNKKKKSFRRFFVGTKEKWRYRRLKLIAVFSGDRSNCGAK